MHSLDKPVQDKPVSRACAACVTAAIVGVVCAIVGLAFLGVHLGWLPNGSPEAATSSEYDDVAGAWHGRDYMLTIEPDGTGTLVFNTERCTDSCTHEASVTLDRSEADTYLSVDKPADNAVPDKSSTIPASGSYMVFIANVPLDSPDDREMSIVDTTSRKTIAHACTSLRHPTQACAS